MSISSKNSLAIADFLAKKKRSRSTIVNTLFLEPPPLGIPNYHIMVGVVKTVLLAKRSFCWGDARHSRHFRRSPGSEGQSPLFLWVEWHYALSEFSPILVKTTCFLQGTKPPFSKTTVSTTLTSDRLAIV